MRAIVFLLLLPAAIFSQGITAKLKKNSEEVFIYKLPSATAEKYMLWDSIPVDDYKDRFPDFRFNRVKSFSPDLPTGFYLYVRIDSNEIVTYVENVTKLLVYPVNNQFNTQFEVRNDEGDYIEIVRLWLGKKEATYHAASKNYWLKNRNPVSGIIKVYAPGDTLLLQADPEEEADPIIEQRWALFKQSKLGRKLQNIGSWFNGDHRYNRYRNNAYSFIGAGYMLLDKPKYKINDTVKLKAYVFNKKKKLVKQDAAVYLEYYYQSKYYSQLLANVSPVSAGSFVYSFHLNDTLPSDVKYTLLLKNADKKVYIRKVFSTEDYLLDEIAQYKFRSEKDLYFPGDTIRLFASAKDANGLSLLDAKASLALTTSDINTFYKDTLYVPDSLYTEERPLAGEGETVFSFPASKLPNASLKIKASVIIRNSNNEMHTETASLNFEPVSKQLQIRANGDSIYADYLVNGKSYVAKGDVDISGDDLDLTKTITYPAAVRIDPLADYYFFTAIDGKDTLSESANLDDRYSITFNRISGADTTGFLLQNPRRIPVNYLVSFGNTLVAAGKSDEANIVWRSNKLNKHKIYQVKWSYYWQGELRSQQETIAVLYKLLSVQIDHDKNVFPGQKDSIKITVSDYKNRPASNVNLAAVAYNSQFKKDIQVNDPPYLVKYRQRKSLVRDSYETDDPFTVKRYQLGEHKDWMKKLGVDSLPFFKMIFPATAPYLVSTPKYEFTPELSVHVVKKGAPQEIYLLYLNRRLVYYNGVTDKSIYSFPAMGYTEVLIRLYDKLLLIDSLYMQPSYKHDVFIDLDNLPAHSTISDAKNYWSTPERNAIEVSTWQLKMNVDEAWVWQYDRVVKISNKMYHKVGPFFATDTMHYFSPGRFDLHFPFEPGYEYTLLPNILRLEKKSIFPLDTAKDYLPKIKSPALVIGDTLQPPPTIQKKPEATFTAPELYISSSPVWMYNTRNTNHDDANLQLIIAKDTIVKYLLFINADSNEQRLTLPFLNKLYNLPPGNYHLYCFNESLQSIGFTKLPLFGGKTFCINTSTSPFKTNDSLITLLRQRLKPITEATNTVTHTEIQITKTVKLPGSLTGNSSIIGKIIDAKGGLPVIGASVQLKGIGYGSVSNMQGVFSIEKIKDGTYTIVISSVGFEIQEIKVATNNDTLLVKIKPSVSHLDEIVVVGYGTSTKRDLTGSVISVRNDQLSYALNGRAAGIAINDDGASGNTAHLVIRGSSSLSSGNPPLYVIDGLLYDKLPDNISQEMITGTEILDGASATGIYGARAANGVVIITTGSKTTRNNFKDNAIWQPEMFTDKNGEASFEVQYPDNITGWQLYVMAMDKKRRMGKGQSFVSSYKPLMAQLSTPQFLVEGDSTESIGKVSNYTSDNYVVETNFSINKQNSFHATDTIQPKEAKPVSIALVANTSDTLHTAFRLQTSTGFADGEERNIPVVKAGMLETKGQFYILQNDTTIQYKSDAPGSSIEMYAQNNTLDLLLDELKWLKNYPYFCMEQTASKLKGLYAEKQIMQSIHQPFNEEKQIAFLQKRLAENQLFEGGWSWWEKGIQNFYITCYIVNTLTEMERDAMMQTAYRSGLISLQNMLPKLSPSQTIDALFVMAKAHHAIDFTPYLQQIPFDSLLVLQQWKWISICKEQKLDYSQQLKKLIDRRITMMPAGCYWGNENYRWYSNATATTLLAFQFLQNEKGYENIVTDIVQYFLQQRKNGRWQNTVESASLTAALLPYLLEKNQQFNNKASITIAGDTSCTISEFPKKITIADTGIQHLSISKQGGGLTFFTVYQKRFNTQPKENNTHFTANSWFESKGKKLSVIPAGEKIKMVVELENLSEADYVMLEIPIPAGCNYASKPQDYSMHYEYLKNKTEIFIEHLGKGTHRFEIELESRYKGKYTLNLVQASLMYFPTFSGNNTLGKVAVQ